MTVLREMRAAVGLTAYELAKLVGISASRLSYLERGIDKPTEEEIDRFASVFSQRAQEAKERLAKVSATRLRESVE